MTSSQARPVPVCGKCGAKHFNVFDCDGVHINALARRKSNRVTKPEGFQKQPTVQWGESMEGFHSFGDRSDNFDFLGGKTLLRKEDS